jgi:hypothetical protein
MGQNNFSKMTELSVNSAEFIDKCDQISVFWKITVPLKHDSPKF